MRGAARDARALVWYNDHMGNHSATEKRARFNANRLSNDELESLAVRARAGDKLAMDRAVRALTGLVLSIVSKFVKKAPSTHIHYDDLVSEGLRAVAIYFPRFERGRGGTVSNYLTPCILGFVKTEARQYLSPVGARVTRRAASGPKDDPIFRATGSVEVGHGDDHHDAEPLVDDKARSPEAVASNSEESSLISDRLSQALSGMTNSQREVLLRRFGVDRNTPAAFHDIAVELGVSDEWARAMFHRAMRELEIKPESRRPKVIRLPLPPAKTA